MSSSSVSPAVVSVRVKAKIEPAADDGIATMSDGSDGFDNLPDDHPLKRFFSEFRGDGDQTASARAPAPPRSHRAARPVAQGSGFFISEDGYLVTNNHVVADGSAFTVVMNDGNELDAKLIGTDPRTDLAVLKVDGSRKFTYVDFADDGKVRVGDWVVAVGNPFGLGGTVTAGIVSARGRDIGAGPYDDFIQIDAAVNRGNSGGPTFNLNGQVVGINTAIFSPSGGNVGIAFAIPASTAKQVVGDLMKNGSVQRGWLGVQIQPVTADIAESLGLPAAKGALVSQRRRTTVPAKKAGIKAGDVITAVNGKDVASPKELAARDRRHARRARTVDVTVWRDGKAETFKVDLGTLPTSDKQASADDQAAGTARAADYARRPRPHRHPVRRRQGPGGHRCRSRQRRRRPRHAGRRRHHLGQFQDGDFRQGRHRRDAGCLQGRPQGGAGAGDPRRRQPLRRPAGRQGLTTSCRRPNTPGRRHDGVRSRTLPASTGSGGSRRVPMFRLLPQQ